MNVSEGLIDLLNVFHSGADGIEQNKKSRIECGYHGALSTSSG